MTSFAVRAHCIVAPDDLTYEDFTAGRSAIVRLTEDFPVHVGAPVPDSVCRTNPDARPIVPRGVALAIEACHRLEYDPDLHYGLVLALPSLRSESEYIERCLDAIEDPSEMAPLVNYFGDTPLAHVANLLGVEGPRVRVDTACASGSDALVVAHQWLESGALENVIVVAASAFLTPLGVAGFNSLGALSREDDLQASRPFDQKRSGFVMGEGAAAMWLSNRSHSTAPGYLSGYGQSMNATHMTRVPDDIGTMLHTCTSALAGVPNPAKDLAYISAHGTSTRLNDSAEIRLYRELLGEGRGRVAISSLKSMIGHCLGAASLIEACVCMDVLTRGNAPPTINLDHPEPKSGLDFVPNESREVSGDFVLSNTFGFGGHNSSLLFSREPI
jgi:3-oxoacyl-(acyl-carrier-protein) synthase